MSEISVKKKIVLIGGGGHCRSCIDIIEQENKYEILGILDKNPKIDYKICGYPVLGGDDLIESLAQNECRFLITIGHVKNPGIRNKVFSVLKEFSASLPIIQSPSAIVSKHASTSEGSIIMHFALVNSMAEIGRNCIINNKALVEHDSIIGDNTHISTATVINGNCKIGKNVFVGSNAVINHGISIADDVVIGAGSVVIYDILSAGTYVGNPVRKLSS